MKHKKPAANINELAVSRTDIHFIKPSLIEPDTFSFLGSETEERFNIREDFGERLVPSIKRNIEIYVPCKSHPKHYSMTSRLLDTLTCATGKPLTMMEQARGMSRLVALKVTRGTSPTRAIAPPPTSRPASPSSPSHGSSPRRCRRRSWPQPSPLISTPS